MEDDNYNSVLEDIIEKSEREKKYESVLEQAYQGYGTQGVANAIWKEYRDYEILILQKLLFHFNNNTKRSKGNSSDSSKSEKEEEKEMEKEIKSMVLPQHEYIVEIFQREAAVVKGNIEQVEREFREYVDQQGPHIIRFQSAQKEEEKETYFDAKEKDASQSFDVQFREWSEDLYTRMRATLGRSRRLWKSRSDIENSISLLHLSIATTTAIETSRLDSLKFVSKLLELLDLEGDSLSPS